VSNWVRASAVDDITDGGAKSFAYADKRIALFRTPGGVFASDNRCPHQGYALVRGDVQDGVLTCAWHNWKFELGTGACRHGGENIRTYPVQIRDGQVFIDVADPPAEIIRPDLFRSLTAAMDDLDIGRVARDAMRLQRIGTPLADVVREGVRYAAPRAVPCRLVRAVDRPVRRAKPRFGPGSAAAASDGGRRRGAPGHRRSRSGRGGGAGRWLHRAARRAGTIADPGGG
jgi:nitrite reductase/ring-hydroxylating ferredoxin subunit